MMINIAERILLLNPMSQKVQRERAKLYKILDISFDLFFASDIINTKEDCIYSYEPKTKIYRKPSILTQIGNKLLRKDSRNFIHYFDVPSSLDTVEAYGHYLYYDNLVNNFYNNLNDDYLLLFRKNIITGAFITLDDLRYLEILRMLSCENIAYSLASEKPFTNDMIRIVDNYLDKNKYLMI